LHDEPFLTRLRQHNVDIVIDIRLRNSGPRYRFGAGEHIKNLALAHRISYEHDLMFAPTDEILRAWWRDKDWPSYIREFNKLMDDRDVVQLWKDRYSDFHSPCLLCMEKTPEQCHRRLLAERIAAEFGVPIIHLM
jgi:hypothetical protein